MGVQCSVLSIQAHTMFCDIFKLIQFSNLNDFPILVLQNFFNATKVKENEKVNNYATLRLRKNSAYLNL